MTKSQKKLLKKGRGETVSVVRGTLGYVDMVILGQCVDMVKHLKPDDCQVG